MTTLMDSIQAFSGALEDLRTLCTSMKKYESSFSAEAKQLFQGVNSAAEHATKELEHLPPADASIAGYLARGNKTLSLRTVLQQVQQGLSGFNSGSVPVPRSSKEELSRVHGLILAVKFSLSSEEHQLITQLRKLCAEVEARKQDFDVIETNLDITMRNVLQQVHGQAVLEPQLLESELERLQSGISEARETGTAHLADILALAMNSLQRLHADQATAGSDEDEDDAVSSAAAPAGEDEEDEDDDPFFMPMPGAIKWAEASKFTELAKPLTPEQPADKQFMIVMEDDDTSQTPSSIAGIPVEPSAQQLVGTAPAASAQTTSVPASPEASPVLAAAAVGATAAAIAATPTLAAEAPELTPPETPTEATGGEAVVSESAVATPASTLTETPATGAETTPVAAPADSVTSTHPGDESAPQTPEATPRDADGKAAAPLLLPADERAASSAAKPAAAATPTEGPTPEKLTDFVNFLNGENPGACMFHAQMRLSVEGCMKLANFLRSSARVRALSLSHNYLGDAGLKLICDGLKENKSVTALDLPDNNITDVGAGILAESIKDNPSLTQLQLAYNKIGDQGAMALAQVIRTSHSLKKLGLAFNNIGKAGCQALTSAISSNQSLKHMQLLPGNPVEEKDAKALAKALKRNNKFSIKQLLGLKQDA